MRVSVVVPVYNAGEYLRTCVDSFLAQTMPADERELVLVDDASTDGTSERLDALAAEHDTIRVVHRERGSGWSGTPRNDGVRAAVGDFVHFVDQDDALAPAALERLDELGNRTEADVVIGKAACNFRPISQRPYDRPLDGVPLADAPYLVETLTPHKMFRRSFLLEHGIFFPEGKRRLEDQPFIMRTYLSAKRISVYADEPCYLYQLRSDGKHTARQKIDPVAYFGYLREVLDVVVAETEPGELRNTVLQRWYRTELQRWLTGAKLRRLSAGFVEKSRREVEDILATYYAAGEDEAYPIRTLVQGRLIASGRHADSDEFSWRMERFRGSAWLESASWDETGLTGRIAGMIGAGGRAFRFERAYDGRLRLPSRLTVGLRGVPEVLRTEAEVLAACEAEIALRHRGSGAEWRLGALEPTLAPVPVGSARAGGTGRADGAPDVEVRFAGELALDPETAHGGRAMPRGRWDLYLRLRVAGVTKKVRLDVSGDAATAFRAVRFGTTPITPYVTVDGTLAVAVGVRPPMDSTRMAFDATTSRVEPNAAQLRLALAVAPVDTARPLVVRLTAGRVEHEAPAALDDAGRVVTTFDTDAIAGRTWRVSISTSRGPGWASGSCVLRVPTGDRPSLIPRGAPQPMSRSRRRERVYRFALRVDVWLNRIPTSLDRRMRWRRRLHRTARRLRLI